MFALACGKAGEVALHMRWGQAPQTLAILVRDSIVFFGGDFSIGIVNFVLLSSGPVSCFLPGCACCAYAIGFIANVVFVPSWVRPQSHHLVHHAYLTIFIELRP